MNSNLNVVALAGGVGGARLSAGLAQVLPPQALIVIVNIGDDFEHLGLSISPDIDTVTYTLAGLESPETGWGRRDETWNALGVLEKLGGEPWFRLGDRDLGLHLERTRRLKSGETLTQVTQHFANQLGVGCTILPASDHAVPTLVHTDEGVLPFQEYFVRRGCRPHVTGFEFQNVKHALAAPGALAAIQQADLVIICPSNPWVSIDPILAIPGYRQALSGRPVLAVSPIIGGQAVKGPAAKMYAELGIEPSALAVARHYVGLLWGFVLDQVDASQVAEVSELGMYCAATDTLMRTSAGRRRVAQEVLSLATRWLETSDILQ
jgi:LPPG:FO 2-phospho-L-lactate transferase